MKTGRIIFILFVMASLLTGGCTCGGDDDDKNGPNGVLDDTADDTSDDTDDDTDDDTLDDTDDDSTDDSLDDSLDDSTDDSLDDTDDDTDPEAPVTTANPPGGWFDHTIVVTLTSVDNDDPTPTIYYTTDGTDPEPGQGTTQSGPTPVNVPVNVALTLKFFAIDASDNRETTKQEDYNIDLVAPSCYTTPTEGNYGGPYAAQGIPPLTVTITCEDAGDPSPLVYVTTDGSDPDSGDYLGESPLEVQIQRTTQLKYYGADHVGREDSIHDETFGIYYWDTFDNWPAGQTPGSPWWMSDDPWNGTIPRIQPLFTPPAGRVLQIIDDNICSDGIRDTWGSLQYLEPLPFPVVFGLQAYMRLRADADGGFGTFYKQGPSEPWRIVVFFRDGDIKSWDQSLNGGLGGYVTCLTDATLDQWYFIDVTQDRMTNRYSVEIDGNSTPCTNLTVFFEAPGLPSDVSGVKFATEGPPQGTVEFDNFRIYIP